MCAFIFHVGNVIIRCVELRIQTGWFGDQPQGRKRLDRTIAKDTLAKKTGHTVETINGSGIYFLVHKPTRQIYVGQAKNLGDRILQHICDATSFRDVSGNVDKLLRQNADVNQWEVLIHPCAKEYLDKLERSFIRTVKDIYPDQTLNIQCTKNK